MARQRITVKQLESLVETINETCGWPDTPYAMGEDGKPLRKEDGGLIANGGHVYLSGAYGGYRLEQMCEGGGCRDFLSTGYAPKREVFEHAHAFLAGVRAAK